MTEMAELARAVRDLAERVASLEAAPSGAAEGGPGDLGLVQAIIAGLPTADRAIESGAVVYAGAGPGPDGLAAFQMDRRWDQLLGAEPTHIAAALAALANPHRVQIVQVLIGGAATTAEITDALEGPSTGQLFHHLKELLAAGLVHQPSRGSYAIRPQHLVPLLVAMSCAIDLAVPQVHETHAP